MDWNAVEDLTGDRLVLVEGGQKMESSLGELGICQQCPADVSSTHDNGSPVVIETEDLSKGGDEVVCVVSDTGLADLAEMTEILSNLRGRDVQSLTELS